MQLFYSKTKERKIEDKDYYVIVVIDDTNEQYFYIYKQKTDTKAKDFVMKHKKFDDITSEISFAIKRDRKISLDIK